MKYPMLTQTEFLGTLSDCPEPVVGQRVIFGSKTYEVVGKTGFTHGVAFTNGELPEMDSINFRVKEVGKGITSFKVSL